MKQNSYKYAKFIIDIISIKSYISYTNQRVVLPFYHSVTDFPKPHLSEIGYFRTKNTFLEDLHFFIKNYQSIAINKINEAKNNSFHVSFDDGLAEIYTEIAPILKSKNIDATFFVCSDFIDNKELFLRHKISVILHQLKQSNSDLEKICSYLLTDKKNCIILIDHIKYEKIINQIASLIYIDFKQYLSDNQPYLTTSQLIELKKEGFTIGNHSKNHPNFKDISFDEQKFQISHTNKFLKHNFDVEDLYFSFPFGDENIKNEFFEYLFEVEKIKNSFGVSGLKLDYFSNHLHRIPMEYANFSAEQIIKFEYFYFLLKSFLRKNTNNR